MSSSNSNFPQSGEIHSMSRARQRRKRRSFLPEGQSERKSWMEALGHQLTPSYDYFLASLLSGMILGAALLVHSRALLFLGILFAPFLSPVIGIAFSASTGSIRFLVRSIFSLAISALFIFGLGALAGALAPIIMTGPAIPYTEWNQLQLVNFLVTAIGAGLCVYMLVRSPRQKPLIASAAMAYGLLLPVTAAGYNLTAAAGSDWIAPLVAAGIHLVWAILVGIVMFVLLGLPPTTLSGTLLTALIIGLLIAPFMAPYGAKSLVLIITPTKQSAGMSETPAPTTAAAMPTSTATPQPDPAATATFTATQTIQLTPSATPTGTVTPISTPILARISAPTGGGAYLRDEPDGKILSSILNGNLIEVISEPLRGNNGVIWVQIRTADGFTGWIVQSLLATATPSAGW